jgi:glucan 1,3-beta-glucosidase
MLNSPKLRGVNLGGWLVLEKWMTPSLFANLKAEDETTWCVELGEQAANKLQQHWQSFITEADFAWLAEIGINAVRIPVGHWLFGADYPYHPSYQHLQHPYVTGGDKILDQAMAWAERYQLKVVLDLHAAPGCQNGFDNGGINGVCEWHTRDEYIQHSLTVLERLAERYRTSRALIAIEVLNEPRWDVPTEVLSAYTEQAYQRIRKHCNADDVAVVFHDGFRDYREYAGLLQSETDSNVIFDIHRYQCFVQDDIDTDVFGHISKAVNDWRQEAEQLIQDSGRKTYVGEWSLGLHPKMLDLWAEQALDYPAASMDEFQQNLAYRGYAAAQLACFEKYQGWFFWSYKTETMPQWSFRDSVKRGWFPNDFR